MSRRGGKGERRKGTMNQEVKRDLCWFGFNDAKITFVGGFYIIIKNKSNFLNFYYVCNYGRPVVSGGPGAPLQLDDDVLANEVREEGLWVDGLEGHREGGLRGETGTRGGREGQLEPFANQNLVSGLEKCYPFSQRWVPRQHCFSGGSNSDSGSDGIGQHGQHI